MWRFFSTIKCLAPLTLAAAVCAPAPASAHPHVWVTVETEVLYNDNKAITGFRHKWDFDEYYSVFAIQGLDKNGDGEYDRAELAELAEVNVSSLKDFGYFTFPKLAGTELERERPEDYYLEYDGTKLTLFLTVPLKEPLPADQSDKLVFGIYDPTFYVDFAFAKEKPVRLSGAPTGCAPVVKDPNPDEAQTGVSSLGEAFFNELDASSTIAEQYAKSIKINCAAS